MALTVVNKQSYATQHYRSLVLMSERLRELSTEI